MFLKQYPLFCRVCFFQDNRALLYLQELGIFALYKSCKVFTKTLASSLGRDTVKRTLQLNLRSSTEKKMSGSSLVLCIELFKLNFQVSNQILKPDGRKMWGVIQKVCCREDQMEERRWKCSQLTAEFLHEQLYRRITLFILHLYSFILSGGVHMKQNSLVQLEGMHCNVAHVSIEQL